MGILATLFICCVYSFAQNVTISLTLESLNPFINSLDVICTSKKDGQYLAQQFTNSDFMISGGPINFNVPSEFLGQGNKLCTLTFGNLFGKYMDETYGNGTNGNTRSYFVKSAYYNTYGDGKQYTTNGNEVFDTKVSTTMCGDQPFIYSNIDDLDLTNTTAATTTLMT